jgi:hypothetical protein
MQGKQKRSRAYKRFARERLRRTIPPGPEKGRVNWLAHGGRLIGMFIVHAIFGGN